MDWTGAGATGEDDLTGVESVAYCGRYGATAVCFLTDAKKQKKNVTKKQKKKKEKKKKRKRRKCKQFNGLDGLDGGEKTARNLEGFTQDGRCLPE